MAKLSTPEEMEELEESDGTTTEQADPKVPPEPEIPTVDFAGEGEIPITDAVESLSKITQHPEAFEVASADQIMELKNENYELRQQLEELREDLAVLWAALSTELSDGTMAVQTSEGEAYAAESVDEFDPLSEVGENDG